MKALFRLLVVVCLAFSSIPIIFNPVSVQASNASEPAPEIKPAKPNGLDVLFDNTHGQTAGAADWVIDGAFSDFANAVADNGYYVKELRKNTAITTADLKDYEVFVIPEANIPYKKSEQDVLIEYIQNGGSIFFIADHYNADRNKNRWDSSEVMNGYRRGAFNDPAKGMSADEKNSAAMQGVQSSDWLSDNFGLRFRYNAVGDVNATMIVKPEETFDITEGVKSVAMHAGSTVMITDPTKAKGLVYLPEGLTSNDKWGPSVDQGVYFGGGINEGAYVAISKLGKGKAAFIGDSSPVEDATPKYVREENGQTKKTYDGFKEQDDAKLLVNMMNWLAKQEAYTNFNEAGIPLDNVTPSLDMEVPSKSTEPQPEPWSAPAPGYKWYDPSTFAPGSYNGPKKENPNPVYSFVHQDILPNADTFQIRVVLDKLNPSQVVSDLQVGIYVDGGQQVAKFQQDDGTWPTNYGYSSSFSVKADVTGRVTKDITVQMKPGTKGDANLRLREGKVNILTKRVKIDNVPSIPLPEDTGNLPAKVTIADARTKAEGTTVTVEGTITSKPGVFGGKGFYLQDETGGIYIYQTEDGFNVGDVVRITAVTKVFNTEFELENIVKIEKKGTASLPASKIVTELNESNQGQLVTFENVTIQNIKQVGKAFEFDIVKGDKATRVRVDERTGMLYSAFSTSYSNGSVVTISGISSVFKGTYQLKPLSYDHIKLVDSEAPVIEDLAVKEFFVTDTFVPEIKVTDKGSGVDTVAVTLNGDAIPTPLKIEPLQVFPGKHVVTVVAMNKAGNKSEKSFELVAKMDVDHLDELLVIGKQKGYITSKAVTQILTTKVNEIQQAETSLIQKGKITSLRVFVESQAGVSMDKRYAKFWRF
jgi:DNA/RNA endonuclease YhcR with UshA esterase domain